MPPREAARLRVLLEAGGLRGGAGAGGGVLLGLRRGGAAGRGGRSGRHRGRRGDRGDRRARERPGRLVVLVGPERPHRGVSAVVCREVRRVARRRDTVVDVDVGVAAGVGRRADRVAAGVGQQHRGGRRGAGRGQVALGVLADRLGAGPGELARSASVGRRTQRAHDVTAREVLVAARRDLGAPSGVPGDGAGRGVAEHPRVVADVAHAGLGSRAGGGGLLGVGGGAGDEEGREGEGEGTREHRYSRRGGVRRILRGRPLIPNVLF